VRAFVTGASGFLGGRLVQSLAARGTPVWVLARHSNDLTHLAGLPVEVVYGNLADLPVLETALRDITHVFHCAASSTDWASPRTYQEANVTGTMNLLRASANARDLKRFLHVSTTDVYGYPLQVCNESHRPVDMGLPYNRTKCLGERAVQESNLPVTVIRPATIYGPRSIPFGSDMAKLIRQRLMAVIDGGMASVGALYIDNAVEAIIAAASAGESLGRAYNLSDGTGVNWRTYVDALADGLGLKRPWIDLPARAAFALARAAEAPYRYLRIPGRPLLTRHAVYLLSRDQEYPIDRIRRELGFAPAIGFAEGMARLVRWLKSGIQEGIDLAGETV
jgi:nucleoside-diphosphate-sugar epimerase